MSRSQAIRVEREAAPGDDREFVHCATCGDRIGMYERLVYELPDGSQITTGLLSLPDDVDRLDARARHFHLGCRPRRPALGIVPDA